MALAPLSQPWNDVPVLGPIGVAISGLTTVSQQVIGADPVRHGIIFHNPGAINKRVAPANMTLAGGSGGILIYPQSEFQLLQDEQGSEYNVNTAWIAVTDDNSEGILTALNFTDNNPSVTNAPNPTMRQNQRIPINSPNGVGIATVGMASAQVIGANPERRGIIFMNPGSVAIAVCPSNLAAANGAGSIIILPGAEKRIIGNRRVKINCAWNGIAASGSNNALTMLELLG